MSKSAVYAYNTATQAVSAGDAINLGAVSCKMGCGCDIVGSSIITSGVGYYALDVVVNAAPTAAGVVSVQLYKDGVPVPGTEVSMLAAAGGDAPLPISYMFRAKCCYDSVQRYSVVYTGVAGAVDSVTARVIKL